MAPINSIGPRPTYTPPTSGNVTYPRLTEGGTAPAGKGAAMAQRADLWAGPGKAHQNQIMRVLQQFMQVMTQMLGMLSKLLGGQQPQAGSPTQGVAPGEPAPGTNPGIAAGEPAPSQVGGGTAVGGVGGATDGSKVPWISQMSPAGAQFGYQNGPANCGPASMAMIARSMGYGANMTDAQLINQLGAIGGTTGEGSSINGIVAMAQAMGATAEINGPKADLNWIDQQLAAGKSIVANGDYYSEPGHFGNGPSGHYLDVVGKSADGNYIIRDPMDQGLTTMSPAELTTFINNNPVNGGFCVAIGK